MSEPTKPEGNESEGAQTPETPEAGKDNAQTFTQEDVDRIVKDRVARAKPADYDDLKRKAEAFDAAEEAQKTELQKAQDAAAEAARERDEAKAEAARERLTARIETEAARQGGDTELVLAVLSQREGLEIDGVKSAVEKLLKEKPNLKMEGGVPGQSGGEFRGANQQTTVERIAELEKKGDKESLAEARALKIQNALGV